MEIQFAQMFIATILSTTLYRKIPSFPRRRESSGFSEAASTPLDSRLRGNDGTEFQYRFWR